MIIYREFKSEGEARTYRHEHGTGGWIYVPDDGSGVILFPPEMMPTAIFHHPLAKGNGALIGSG